MDAERCARCGCELDSAEADCPHCGIADASAVADGVGSGASIRDGDGALLDSARADRDAGSDAPGSTREVEGDDDTVGRFETEAPTPSQEGSETWGVGHLVAGRFRLGNCIGQGGMGKVFLARDEILGRPIALKRVPQEIIFDYDARDDLRHEANRLLDLAHENIVRVHTYYDEPDWPFFAMEYLKGPTLKKLLGERKRESRRFTFDEVETIARQVGRGLDYAHGKNLIHRDLKPANLMLVEPPGGKITDADTVKITDFGISRVVADSTLRQTGKRSGTLPYMSPEQFRGEECTVESDVYSLAAAYYELLSGKPPFYTGDIGYQILSVAPKPIEGLPSSVNGVLLRALAKNPQHRYRSVREFTDALERRSLLPDPYSLIMTLRRLGLRVAAVALILVLVAFAGMGVRSLFTERADVGPGGAATPRGGSAASAGGAGAPRRAAAGQVEHADVSIELNKQLRSIKPDTRESVLTFRIERTEIFQRYPAILEGLFFILDPLGEARRVDGRPVAAGGEVEFTVDGLQEGRHTLQADFDDDAKQYIAWIAIQPIERTFTVIATGPQFRIEPVVASDFVALADDQTGTFATFRDDCKFKLKLLDSSGSDVARAKYSKVSTDLESGVPPTEWEIPSHGLSWDVPLEVGENVFQVYAIDRLGNRSPDVTLRVRRLRLGVEPLFIDRQLSRGNLAIVRGSFNVEGDEIPRLLFFVNDQPVRDPQTKVTRTEIGSPSFRADLRLPKVSSTIEVRYEWGGEARSFSPPAVISNVQVIAPEVVLSSPTPARTNQATFKVAGTVSPCFNGLQLKLNHTGASQLPLPLRPGPCDEYMPREFALDVALLPDKTNTLEIECFYNNEPILPAPERIVLYCDRTDPGLLEAVRFLPQGFNMRLLITPSEALKELLVREAGAKDWEPLVEEPEGEYSYYTRLPDRKTVYELSLTDVAGNMRVLKAECNVFAVADDVEPAAGHGGGAPTPAVLRGGMSPKESEEMLRSLGLAFWPYGDSGDEMGTTEVTERAWSLYLTQSGVRAGPEGSETAPAVIGPEFRESLVLGFVEWLNRVLDDGFEYHIPTPDQWRVAFVGSKDPSSARTDIACWFEGGFPEGWNFDPRPKERYRINRVLDVASRPENRTQNKLYDMESNLQEIVRDASGRWWVIGGWNTLRSSELKENCLDERELGPSLKDFRDRFTGLRVGRRKSP